MYQPSDEEDYVFYIDYFNNTPAFAKGCTSLYTHQHPEAKNYYKVKIEDKKSAVEYQTLGKFEIFGHLQEK